MEKILSNPKPDIENRSFILNKGKEERIGYLDGIRGIASILVILCHLSCVFFPEFYTYQENASLFSIIFLDSPLNVLTNGHTPVHTFFVLSGFLITRKIYGLKQNNLTAFSPLKQYFKFVKIVFPAILFTAILMWCGLMFHIKAEELNPALNIAYTNNFSPSFLSAFVTDPFIRVFTEGSMYVGPFWTIRYEFYGAILITAISYFAKDHIKIAKIFYIFCGLIFVLISPHLVSFIIGAFVFDSLNRKDTDESWIGKIVHWILSKKILIAFLIIPGIYFACINQTMTGIWSPLKRLPNFIYSFHGVLRAFGIGLCLICISEFSFLQKVLSIKPLKWLGKISPFTYGFHQAIKLSLGCGIYILLAKAKISNSVSALIISLSVITATILLAFLYTKLLPLFAIVERWIGRKICSLFKKSEPVE